MIRCYSSSVSRCAVDVEICFGSVVVELKVLLFTLELDFHFFPCTLFSELNLLL